MAQTFNYSKIRNTAQTLVKKFGRPCILLRPVEATPSDATKPWRVGDGTTTEFACRGVFTALPFPKRSDPIVDASEADLMIGGDIGTEPLLTDRIQVIGVITGETNPIYAIIGVHRIDPDGTPIAYGLRIRSWSVIVSAPAPGL